MDKKGGRGGQQKVHTCPPLKFYYKRIFQLYIKNLWSSQSLFFVRLTAYTNQRLGLNFFEFEISRFQSLHYFCNTQPLYLSAICNQQSQIFVFIQNYTKFKTWLFVCLSLILMVDDFDLCIHFYLHCKYLNKRFEFNGIVIFIYSHYSLNPNAKLSDTECFTLSIR